MGGLARCATQIRQWRRESPHHLLLDVGDVYQGTEVGWRTKGDVMVRALNALQYDSWVLGNHEFDWGIEPLAQAVEASQMPVLGANCQVAGRKPGGQGGEKGLDRLRSYFIKEVAGFRIAVIGVTTPGLPYWLAPELMGPLSAFEPEAAVRAALAELKQQPVDAVVVTAHMGLKGKEGDDFANRLNSLTRTFPEVAVVLMGHTHRSVPSQNVNGVLVTQANYYGTYVGRVDLTFDRRSRRLVRKAALTQVMDRKVALDPVILSVAQPFLDASAQVLEQPAGLLAEALSATSMEGQSSEVERLIGAALWAGLVKRQIRPDGIVHGSFGGNDLAAGPKTIGEWWKVIPFENFIVTGEFTPAELCLLAEDTLTGKDRRSWFGLKPVWADRKVIAVTGPGGKKLEEGRRYRLAMNSYDAASGGQRFLKVRALMEQPRSKRTWHPIQTREALIEFMTEKKQVTKRDLLQIES
jgi:2',3'-cyclic-nucleotide 2'-phosphodiesterase/3'-nucleotidase